MQNINYNILYQFIVVKLQFYKPQVHFKSDYAPCFVEYTYFKDHFKFNYVQCPNYGLNLYIQLKTIYNSNYSPRLICFSNSFPNYEIPNCICQYCLVIAKNGAIIRHYALWVGSSSENHVHILCFFHVAQAFIYLPMSIIIQINYIAISSHQQFVLFSWANFGLRRL